jgi:hypothetical protein
MDTLIFSGTVKVDLQGSGVLRFNGVDGDRVEYTLAGFIQPRISLVDERPAGLAAILQYLDSGRGEAFAAQFSSPAGVTISVMDPRLVSVVLYPTFGTAPKHTLTLALLAQSAESPLDGSHILLPQHCLFSRSADLKDGRTAFLALYHQPAHIASPVKAIKSLITNGANKSRIPRLNPLGQLSRGKVPQ